MLVDLSAEREEQHVADGGHIRNQRAVRAPGRGAPRIVFGLISLPRLQRIPGQQPGPILVAGLADDRRDREPSGADRRVPRFLGKGLQHLGRRRFIALRRLHIRDVKRVLELGTVR